MGVFSPSYNAMSQDRDIQNILQKEKNKWVFVEIDYDFESDSAKNPAISETEKVLAYMYIIRNTAMQEKNKSIRILEDRFKNVLTYGESDFSLGVKRSFALTSNPETNINCVDFYIYKGKDEYGAEIDEQELFNNISCENFEEAKNKKVTQADFEKTKRDSKDFLIKYAQENLSTKDGQFIGNIIHKIEKITSANFENFAAAIKGIHILNWILITNLDGGPLNDD